MQYENNPEVLQEYEEVYEEIQEIPQPPPMKLLSPRATAKQLPEKKGTGHLSLLTNVVTTLLALIIITLSVMGVLESLRVQVTATTSASSNRKPTTIAMPPKEDLVGNDTHLDVSTVEPTGGNVPTHM